MLQLCVLMKYSFEQRHFRQQTQRKIDWKEADPGGLLYIWRFFLDVTLAFEYRSLKTHKGKNHMRYINASKILTSDVQNLKVSSVHEVLYFCLSFFLLRNCIYRLLNFSQRNHYTLIYFLKITSYKPTVHVYDEYKHSKTQFHPDCKKLAWLQESAISSIIKHQLICFILSLQTPPLEYDLPWALCN